MKTGGSFWQYCRDKSIFTMADSESIEFKAIITDRTPVDDNTKDVEIAIPLKYLNTLRVTLNIPLIKYEINI